MEFVGQTALITGASTGIGAVFAHQLAARGAHLILAARSEDRLRALAADLTETHGVRVDVLPADLTRPGAGEDLADRVAALGRTVDVLVNNAGFATHGDVEHADPARLLERTGPAQLHRRGGPDNPIPARDDRPGPRRDHQRGQHRGLPADRPHGRLLGQQGLRALVHRGAVVRGQAPRRQGHGPLPGRHRDPVLQRRRRREASFGKRRTPEQVVATALRGLAEGKPSVVDGCGNALLARFQRFLPHRVVLNVAERSVRPRNAA
jgi:hypothetical protein